MFANYVVILLQSLFIISKDIIRVSRYLLLGVKVFRTPRVTKMRSSGREWIGTERNRHETDANQYL